MSSLSSPPQTRQLTALLWPHWRDFSLKCRLRRMIPAGTCCPRLRLGRKTSGMEKAVICAELSEWRREDALPDGCFLRNRLAGSCQHRQPSQQAAGCCGRSEPALPPSCCPSNAAASGKSIRGTRTSFEGLLTARRVPWPSPTPLSWGSGGRKHHRAGKGLRIHQWGLL